MIYGSLPEDLGLIDLSPVEMMFWMYCPIAVPGGKVTIPDNLEWARPIVHAALDDSDNWRISYVYLTAKTLWISDDYIGNRPGWHSDGFDTDDINYVWCDREPTEFLDLELTLPLPSDCAASMRRMEEWARFPLRYGSRITKYPDKHLLRLDQSVIHRCPVGFAPGMRTFVKVSISHDRYDLEGNSINHLLGEQWSLKPRQIERNHPHSGAA